MPRHILMKIAKVEDKESIIKAENKQRKRKRTKNQVTGKGNSTKLSSDFSEATLLARRE